MASPSLSSYGSRSPEDPERRSPPLDDELLTPSEQKRRSVTNASRYKTELCRPFMESGNCKYGEKCQFAHGTHEVRAMARHPKYKTEYCRTFHSSGFCPYGPRCHFIHDPSEKRERCTPTTPRSYSMSSPMTPFPGPGRSPSPPSTRASEVDSPFGVRRTAHKPVQRQFSSPAVMGRASVSSVVDCDDIFRRISPPASPQHSKSNGGDKMSMSCLQDAIDSVVIAPRATPTKSSYFTAQVGVNNNPMTASSPMDINQQRRLPVFNNFSHY